MQFILILVFVFIEFISCGSQGKIGIVATSTSLTTMEVFTRFHFIAKEEQCDHFVIDTTMIDITTDTTFLAESFPVNGESVCLYAGPINLPLKGQVAIATEVRLNSDIAGHEANLMYSVTLDAADIGGDLDLDLGEYKIKLPETDQPVTPEDKSKDPQKETPTSDPVNEIPKDSPPADPAPSEGPDKITEILDPEIISFACESGDALKEFNCQSVQIANANSCKVEVYSINPSTALVPGVPETFEFDCNDIANANAVTMTLQSFDKNKTYYFRLIASNSDGKTATHLTFATWNYPVIEGFSCETSSESATFNCFATTIEHADLCKIQVFKPKEDYPVGTNRPYPMFTIEKACNNITKGVLISDKQLVINKTYTFRLLAFKDDIFFDSSIDYANYFVFPKIPILPVIPGI